MGAQESVERRMLLVGWREWLDLAGSCTVTQKHEAALSSKDEKLLRVAAVAALVMCDLEPRRIATAGSPGW